MARYTRITYNERWRIRQLLQEGYKISEIARRLNRSKSTISTEVRRKGMTPSTYFPIHAQQNAIFLRKLICRKRRIQGSLEASIQHLMLELRWCQATSESNPFATLKSNPHQFSTTS